MGDDKFDMTCDGEIEPKQNLPSFVLARIKFDFNFFNCDVYYVLV
jgi:hypothetical protein